MELNETKGQKECAFILNLFVHIGNQEKAYTNFTVYIIYVQRILKAKEKHELHILQSNQ